MCSHEGTGQGGHGHLYVASLEDSCADGTMPTSWPSKLPPATHPGTHPQSQRAPGCSPAAAARRPALHRHLFIGKWFM